MIPQPYTLFGGDAGSASEVDLDWIMEDEPDIVTTAGTTQAAPTETENEDEDEAVTEAVA